MKLVLEKKISAQISVSQSFFYNFQHNIRIILLCLTTRLCAVKVLNGRI